MSLDNPPDRSNFNDPMYGTWDIDALRKSYEYNVLYDSPGNPTFDAKPKDVQQKALAYQQWQKAALTHMETLYTQQLDAWRKQHGHPQNLPGRTRRIPDDPQGGGEGEFYAIGEAFRVGVFIVTILVLLISGRMLLRQSSQQ